MYNLTSLVRRLSLCALTSALGIGLTVVIVLLGQPPRAALAIADSSPPMTVSTERHAPEGLSPTPDWVATGEMTSTFFGASAATAGDVNGDGYSDVIVGAPTYMNFTGRAYLYLGAPTGLSLTPAFTATGEGPESSLGVPVGTIGDVNGDGYSDVFITASRVSTPASAYVFIYHGSAAGLGPTPALTLTGEDPSAFGLWSGAAGDVNGDGYSDMLVGAHTILSGTGQVYVYLGSASGLDPTPAFTATGEGPSSYFGFGAGTAGDVNGDGYSDIFVGAFNYYTGTGRAYIYAGAANGLSATPAVTLTDIEPYSRFFGYFGGTAGDVNGDGYSDVMVGTNTGKGYVYLGSGSGLSAIPAFTHTRSSLISVATTGDINGDGYADVIFGLSGFLTPSQASVYFGSSAGLQATNVITLTDNENASSFGYAVGTAGDVNGDGYADVIIGAHYYQSSTGRAYVYHGGPDAPVNSPALTVTGEITAGVGRSVATAGDVNGDGYADVVIGAPNYLSATGQAHLYLGSADGLSSIPAFTATGAAPDSFFGFPVQTAGDVNGDGYDDVIVGASGWPPTQGHAYLYLGSINGLSITPALTMMGGVTADGFGTMVGTAGDVNGDGYSDILVSNIYTANVYHGSTNGVNATPVFTAPTFASPLIAARTAGDVNGDGYSDILVGDFAYYSDTGQAHLYLGSSAGLLPTPVFTATGLSLDDRFGFSVSAAGDVNGDGYADLVIGAKGRENIFLGSLTGPESTPAFTLTHSVATNYAVGAAGDINGDGYADVIVGEAGFSIPGQILIYLGSDMGPGTIPITLTDGITGTYLGESVSTAGDVNGDGYAEVIVGGSGFNGGYGYALLYAGNATSGIPLLPQQRRADDSAPIAHNGQADSADSFRLAAVGRTPFGRGLVKLEWEVKPLGVPFDGASLEQSATWQNTDVAGVALNELVTGLSANTQYHWRVRLLYHPASTPFQSYSRWVTQPWNGWQEADVRTAAPPSIFTLYLPLIRR